MRYLIGPMIVAMIAMLYILNPGLRHGCHDYEDWNATEHMCITRIK
jgi:hypothetical protein